MAHSENRKVSHSQVLRERERERSEVGPDRGARAGSNEVL